MPFICEHCGKKLMSAGSLKTHKESAKSCLEIQKTLGLKINTNKFKCVCGANFNLKHHFNRHCGTCALYQESDTLPTVKIKKTKEPDTSASAVANRSSSSTGDHNTTTGSLTCNGDHNTNTVNNITNVYINTMDSKYVYDKLKSVMTEKIFKEGMGSVVKNIIDGLLLLDDKYIYYCTDRSRSSFKMICSTTSGEVIEENDPEAVKLRELIHIPIMLLIEAIKTKNGNHELNDISESFENLKKDGKDFKKELKTSLPSSSHHIEHKTSSLEEMEKELERLRTFNKKRDEKKKFDESEKYMNNLIDNTTQYYEYKSQYYDSCFRNDITHYIMGLKNQDPYIIGYSNSLKGEMMKLTKNHLIDIKNHNIERYLDPQYTSELATL